RRRRRPVRALCNHHRRHRRTGRRSRLDGGRRVRLRKLAGRRRARRPSGRAGRSDAERAYLRLERRELLDDPAGERAELAAIYRARGLSAHLAEEVAAELSTRDDVLAVHARDGLGMTELSHARPLQAAAASSASFTAGAALPLLAVVLSPAALRVEITMAGSTLAPALTR